MKNLTLINEITFFVISFLIVWIVYALLSTGHKHIHEECKKGCDRNAIADAWLLLSWILVVWLGWVLFK